MTFEEARFEVVRHGLEQVCSAYALAFPNSDGMEKIKRQIPTYLMRIEQLEIDINQNCYNREISDEQWKSKVHHWVNAWQKTFDKVK